MILLKNTTFEFRKKIASKSEPFFLAYKKNPVFLGSYNRICEYLCKAQRRKYDAEIWTLVSATTQAIRYGNDATQLTLDNNNYAKANKITKKKISLNRMKELVSILESHKLLTLYKGYHFQDTILGSNFNMRSCIEFSREWLSFFNERLCQTHGTPRVYDNVVLKDINGRTIDTKGLHGIVKERDILTKFNKLVDKTDIMINGARIRPLYEIVFNVDLHTGGRVYDVAGLQTQPSYLRQTITIDGQDTCEVDYKNNHIRILYNEIGVDWQDDAYQIHCPNGWDAKELRKLCKKAMLVMLNAAGRDEAQNALIKGMYEIKDEIPSIPRGESLSGNTANYIFAELVRKHQKIQDHFFKGEWGRLQHLDSVMAKYVMNAFAERGIVALPWHDSFVVQSQYKDLLIDLMREAWVNVLGSEKGFGYDVEYDASEVIIVAEHPSFSAALYKFYTVCKDKFTSLVDNIKELQQINTEKILQYDS